MNIRKYFSILFLIIFFSVVITANAAQTALDEGSLHIDWLDKSKNPHTDFFAYANGNWQKHNPIPNDYSQWSIFSILDHNNRQLLKNLLIQEASATDLASDNTRHKLRDFYLSGMDQAMVNRVGIKPLQPLLERINNISNLEELQSAIAFLQLQGVEVGFDFGQMQDYADSTHVIGIATQGGLGLPDKDYYLKNGADFANIRHAYVQYIANMLVLSGEKKSLAESEAKQILNMETALAKASLSRIEQRDFKKTYHLMDIAALNQLTPHFSWDNFFNSIGHSEIKNINMATPGFFVVFNKQLVQLNLSAWKAYLRWHLLQSTAPYLSKAFVKESFRFSAIITGTKKILPRWQQVLNAEEGALGFALGKLYVEQAFPASSKKAVQEIVANIRGALEKRIKSLSWMTTETKQQALNKLQKMHERIGYPDQWLDYSALEIDKGPYVLNVLRARVFNIKRELNKIGKPVDKNEWDMTPQTVNAYYDPSMNTLNLPAGILQPPVYNPNAPAAINYGAIGFVIGHEITHGFDDQGAQFDGDGNLENWWTAADLQQFQAATHCIASQYSSYTVAGNAHVQGELVVGEASADLGGLNLAYQGFKDSKDFKSASTLHGMTPEQQFFLGAAHSWAMNIRSKEAQRLVIVDPHPPARYRVNGTIANMPQFSQAFAQTSGNKLINQYCDRIW